MEFPVSYPSGIRVNARQGEVEIESYSIFLGPHMVGTGPGEWALELGRQRTKHAATVIDEKTLRFSNIPCEEDANELIGLIDAIIKMNEQRVRMLEDFTAQFTGVFKPETSSLHIDGAHGNVSLYNINDLLIVYLQSDDEPPLFEPFLAPEFGPVNETDDPSYVLSCDGQTFPGAQYVEDEIYQFCFRYPRDEAQIRMLVPVVARMLRA